jgi:type III secretion protein V
VLALGHELSDELQRADGARLQAALAQVRERVADTLGFELPALRVQTRDDLAGRAYRVTLSDVVLAQAVLSAGDGKSEDRLAQALCELLVHHAAELLDLQHTQTLLDALERNAPALVHNCVPKPVSLRLLCEVLRRLLAEGVSIRPLARLLESIASEAISTGDPALLVERVRVHLRRHVSFTYAQDGVLALHPVDAMIEDAVRDALAPSGLALPPAQARDIVDAVRSALGDARGRAVLVVQPDVRRHLRALLEAELPDVAVLSYAELAPELRVERRAPVRIGGAR